MFNRYNYSTLIQKIFRENNENNQDISNNENNQDISNNENIKDKYTVTACFKSIENENIYIFDDELLENIKKISKYIKTFENMLNYINNAFSYLKKKII
jgi:hypothetical protein